MSRQSTVDRHPERYAIERELREGIPAARVARTFNLSRQAVDRFKHKNINKPASKPADDRQKMRQQIEALYNAVVQLVKDAQAAQHPRKFLLAVAEARKCLGLLSKIIGVLNETPPANVNVAVQVDVHQLREVIVTALGPFPEARAAVAQALLEHDQRGPAGEPG